MKSLPNLKNKLQAKFSPWSLKVNQVPIRVDEKTINYQINKIYTLLLVQKARMLSNDFWMTAG